MFRREPLSEPRSLSSVSSTPQTISLPNVPRTPEKSRTLKDRTPAQSGEFPAAAVVVAQSGAEEKQNGHENGSETPLNSSGNIVDNTKEEATTTSRNEVTSEPQSLVTPQKKTLQIGPENNERKSSKKKPAKDNSILELKPKTF